MADTAAERTTSEEMPAVPVYPVERARVPLVLKLFGVTALLIAAVVGIATAITIQRASTVASETVNKSIAGAARLFDDLEKQRLTGLSVPVQLLGNDSSFYAYIRENYLNPAAETSAPKPQREQARNTTAPPPPAVDLVSLNDQLEQRRRSFGSDVLVLLDDQGRVITRTDQPSVTAASGEDLYEQSPIVKKIIDDPNLPSAAGVVVLGKRLYHAAIAPVAIGTPPVRIAYLLNAAAIDEGFANRIAESTKADVLFMAAGSSTVTRSSGAPSFGMQQMHGVEGIVKTGKRMPPSTQQIDRGSYVLTGEPLMAESKPIGAAVFLRSVDRELAPFRQIQNALILGGGVALLAAFILSWLIAKRMTRPIEQLARMAQAVTNGDYSIQPPVGRRDEVGILGRAFAKMITSLRDKAELEELYQQMAAKSAERESHAHPSEAPKLDEGTVMVTDLRGLPPTVGEGDASKVIEAVVRAMKLQEAEVMRQEGVVREIVGHRLVSVFRGERGIIHAIRASRAINEEMATQMPNQTMMIGVGIATGEFVTGSVELCERERTGDRRQRSAAGVAVRVARAERLCVHLVRDGAGRGRRCHRTGDARGSEVEVARQRAAGRVIAAGQRDDRNDPLDRRDFDGVDDETRWHAARSDSARDRRRHQPHGRRDVRKSLPDRADHRPRRHGRRLQGERHAAR